jgi:hypothetical protein
MADDDDQADQQSDTQQQTQTENSIPPSPRDYGWFDHMPPIGEHRGLVRRGRH